MALTIQGNSASCSGTVVGSPIVSAGVSKNGKDYFFVKFGVQYEFDFKSHDSKTIFVQCSGALAKRFAQNLEQRDGVFVHGILKIDDYRSKPNELVHYIDAQFIAVQQLFDEVTEDTLQELKQTAPKPVAQPKEEYAEITDSDDDLPF